MMQTSSAIIVTVKSSIEYAELCMGMRLGNVRYSACAVDVEASCGGSLRARSAYPRSVPTSAKEPTGRPDGGSSSPVTHPFGHQLPGSLPQRIAEVCPLPTRIALSYLTH
jgi:hypothetical protein